MNLFRKGLEFSGLLNLGGPLSGTLLLYKNCIAAPFSRRDVQLHTGQFAIELDCRAGYKTVDVAQEGIG